VLLYENPLPGYSRFVAHAVREIRNRLPEIISGSVSKPRLDYKTRVDEIVRQWKEAGLPTNGVMAGPIEASDPNRAEPAGISLPWKLAKLLALLVAEHEETREKPAAAAARLFIGVAPENEKFRDALRPAVTQWLEVTNWFMRRVHDSGTVDGSGDKIELQKKFELFEATLVAIVQSFFATTDALDEILEEANS